MTGSLGPVDASPGEEGTAKTNEYLGIGKFKNLWKPHTIQ